MTVSELIEKLKTFPRALPVCLADWSEGYMWPRVEPAERIRIAMGKYITSQFPDTSVAGDADGNEEEHEGEFLQIG